MDTETKTGRYSYQKAIYKTPLNRAITVHFIGYDCNRSECFTEKSLTILSELAPTLSEPLNVFVDFELKRRSQISKMDYLNELTSRYSRVGCLSDTRFHSVDYRATLYMEYMSFIKEAEQSKLTMHEYIKSLNPETELEKVRLIWIDEMLLKRGRYRDSLYAEDFGDFLSDLFFMIDDHKSKYQSHTYSQLRYPDLVVPYYIYRLLHCFKTVPECYLLDHLKEKVYERLNNIGSSYNLCGYLDSNEIGESLRWLMDMYLSVRLLHSENENIVLILNLTHIQQIQEFMHRIGMTGIYPTYLNRPITGYTERIGIPDDYGKIDFDNISNKTLDSSREWENEKWEEEWIADKWIVDPAISKYEEAGNTVYSTDRYLKPSIRDINNCFSRDFGIVFGWLGLSYDTFTQQEKAEQEAYWNQLE